MPPTKKIKLSESYTQHNRTELIRGGKPYFDRLIKMIGEARESIHLQTYIYEDDETGQMVGDALKAAARRNVQVYLLADGYASGNLSRVFVNELREAGIRFRYFNPIFKSRYFYFGRRLHHKIVVTDTRYAMVSGVNITNRYNDMPGQPAWLDFALYIEGEAAKELCIVCSKSWNNYSAKTGTIPCESRLPRFNVDPSMTSRVGIRRNDWVRKKNEISSTYIHMLLTAESNITILCSYFLPGRFIRQHLIRAAKRGINIRVITAGISDVSLAKYAERYMYGWLLKNNITLYEYQSSILHGKIAVCDSKWLTIGSYNINNISAYASIELNANVHDPILASRTEQVLQQIIDTSCIAITGEYYKKQKNIFKQVAGWISYEMIRVIFYLFTFYFKHRR